MTEILFADAADFERWLTQIGAENRRIVVPCIEFVLHNFETLPANRVWTKRVGGDIQQIRIGPTLNHVLRLVDAEKLHLITTKLCYCESSLFAHQPISSSFCRPTTS